MHAQTNAKATAVFKIIITKRAWGTFLSSYDVTEHFKFLWYHKTFSSSKNAIEQGHKTPFLEVATAMKSSTLGLTLIERTWSS